MYDVWNGIGPLLTGVDVIHSASASGAANMLVQLLLQVMSEILSEVAKEAENSKAVI